MHTYNYNRLSFDERKIIERLIYFGNSYHQIARTLQRHPSSIYREVKTHGGRTSYIASKAHLTSIYKRKVRQVKSRLETNKPLSDYVRTKLKLGWSPKQISSRLIIDYPNNSSMRISHEAIYSYIYILPRGELKKELIACLRRSKPKRGLLSSRSTVGARITDMLSIEERPIEVEDRTIAGHWESDLIIGANNKSAIGTIVERTTRYTLLVPVKTKDATNVREAFSAAIKHLPKELIKTMTHDQGSEMAQHRLFTRDTKVKVYFAHPHSPWERGTNENTNGLIRQYYPKGTDFSKVSPNNLKQVQSLLNGRPRAAINYLTPNEAFARLMQSVALDG